MGTVMDVGTLVRTFGLIGVLVVLVVEYGFPIGFFLPGDSLLVVAGVAASPAAAAQFDHRLSLTGLLIGAPLCVIAGAQAGHAAGRAVGARVFSGASPRRLRHLRRAERAFFRLGAPASIVLSRFIPVVRTFISPVAGAVGYPWRRFLLWNVVGALCWAEGIILLAYQVGDLLADKLEWVVAAVIAAAVIPLVVDLTRHRRTRGAAPVPERDAGRDVESTRPRTSSTEGRS
ncbi:VTT domain-containing protein [Actinoplanes sp. NPDC048791]|uniref:DedA family protein n=1 Tax=Actinoplanes sp. NPDC048791 TaxID=3154623 RepID=UPI0033C8E7A7